MSYTAYEELLDQILTNEDREKFEALVGQALSGGEPFILVLEGDVATGKSTLLSIASLVLKDVPGVDIHHDGFDIRRMEPNTKYLLVATDRPVTNIAASKTVIQTTGKTLPTERYHGVMLLIGAEHGLISLRCVDRYITATRNTQEN